MINKLLFTAFFSLFTLTAQAASYQAIIDAGSSGSRLALYEVDKGNLKTIELKNNTTNKGLSSLKDKPEAAANTILSLFDSLKDIQLPDVNVNVLATGGMRLLPEEAQTKIYSAIKQKLTLALPRQYIIGDIKTISGADEGFYDWIAVNLRNNSFSQSGQKTQGAIDLGGASVQIAYEVDKNSTNYNKALSLNNKEYHIFSYSYLGLGVNELYNSLSDKSSCLPKQYQEVGNFDAQRCQQTIQKTLDNFDKDIVHPPKDMQFVAFSGFSYIYEFFTPRSTAVLNHTISGGICDMAWSKMSVIYQHIPEKYLARYCADGTYTNLLIKEVFNFPAHNNNIIVQELKSGDISWSAGAALYYGS